MNPLFKILITQLKKRLRRNGAFVAFCLSLLVMNSSCMTLFQLPLMLIQLPFNIIRMTLNMVLSLLPYVVKYAPLALLFVETDDGLSEYYAELPADMQPIMLAEGLMCVPVDLTDPRMYAQIETVLGGACQQERLVFLKSGTELPDTPQLLSIYTYMAQNNMRYACDARIMESEKSEGARCVTMDTEHC